MRKNRINWGLAVFAIALLISANAGASELGRDSIEKADRIFGASYQAHPIGGMTVGIVSSDRLVWTKSYGWADAASKTPATADSVYRIGSITKQFTAVMLLQLVERGKVALSDPVQSYFPAISEVDGWPPARPITLLDLATHRAGLSREPEECRRGCKYLTGPVADWEQTLLSAMPHIKLESQPEMHVAYSNVGYAILGAALAKAAGQPYTDYVEQHILSPLHMTNTAFEPNAQMLAKLTKGYTVNDAGAVTTADADSELKNGRGYKVPNGALFTTIGDFLEFMSFEMGEGPEDVLKHATLRTNFKRSFAWGEDPGWSYGVGFMTTKIHGHTIIGHTGRVAGYSAAAFFNPESKLGVVCLQNSDGPCKKSDLDALVSILEK